MQLLRCSLTPDHRTSRIIDSHASNDCKMTNGVDKRKKAGMSQTVCWSCCKLLPSYIETEAAQRACICDHSGRPNRTQRPPAARFSVQTQRLTEWKIREPVSHVSPRLSGYKILNVDDSANSNEVNFREKTRKCFHQTLKGNKQFQHVFKVNLNTWQYMGMRDVTDWEKSHWGV